MCDQLPNILIGSKFHISFTLKLCVPAYYEDKVRFQIDMHVALCKEMRYIVVSCICCPQSIVNKVHPYFTQMK